MYLNPVALQKQGMTCTSQDGHLWLRQPFEDIKEVKKRKFKEQYI